MVYSMGKRLRLLVAEDYPVQVVGTINAYAALLAKHADHKAIYLSGAGVANAAYGLPDLGMTTLTEVLEEARRITDSCELPLLVDVDAGWGSPLTIARTVKLMEKTRVAAIHIEDQITSKRCGHRPNKKIISCTVMEDRIKAAVDARTDEQFVLMARTDAYAVEGLNAAIERAKRYVEAGADMLFPEAFTTLQEYQIFCAQCDKTPILANMTEFGKTPLFSRKELKDAGVKLILYPLSAFRAMSKAALSVYKTIKDTGGQKDLIDSMQTRNDLYTILQYHHFEEKLDLIREGQDDN